MTRYSFQPFDVEEQCRHAQLAHYYDRGSNVPALVLLIDGTSACLYSNGIPRLFSDDPDSYNRLVAKVIEPAEVTKNLMINIPLNAFTPLFPHEPLKINIDINDGAVARVSATVMVDE